MNNKITKTKVDDAINRQQMAVPVNSEQRLQDSQEDAGAVNESNDNEKTAVVYPGYEIADSMDVLAGQGAFREGSKVFSKIVGISKISGSVVSVTPLSGVYNPRVKDYVIGEITDVGFSNWSVDICGPYDAVMSTNDVREFVERNGDLTKYYEIGDLIMCVVTGVTKTKFINVGTKDPKARKLRGGLLTQITPSKVPRLIGKQGSMIGMIKDKTKCFITVGQNGRIWIKGDFEDVAKKAVEKVDEWSTQSGLTEKIEAIIEKELKGSKPADIQGENL